PVLPFMGPIPPPFDLIILGLLAALLVWAAIASRPAPILAAFIAAAVCYSLWDQSRWQPWFYQYLWMLATIAVLRRKPEDALDASRLILAAVYFWSGVHKFNSGFLNEAFPWMIEPFPLLRSLARVAIVVPVIETAIGVGLMFAFRRVAVIAALAMHAFI